MASTLVIVIVFIFYLIAFALAIAAEQRRSTAKMVPDAEKKYTYCVYDSNIATGLGVGALLFLLAGQALVMAASRCFCCGRPLRPLRPPGSRSCALFLFLLCWLTFVIAEACLLAGSVRNAYHTRYRYIYAQGTFSCQTLRRGVFGAGAAAAFVFFTAALSEFYYVYYADARGGGVPPCGKEAAVGMGTHH